MEKSNDYVVKKIGKRGKITIFLVDGFSIRKDLSEDFTNFGHHFTFSFVPEYEFWLDKEASPNERRFYVDHMLEEWKLMRNGQSYHSASEAGNRKEMAERKKAGDFKKVIDKSGTPVPEKVHLKKLPEHSSGVSIWFVDGRLVRSVFDVEFTEGGHDLVYWYIPEKEIWIDDDVLAAERQYVLLHEIYERAKMEDGFSYDEAHRLASRLEWKCRQRKSDIEKEFEKLGYQQLL